MHCRGSVSILPILLTKKLIICIVPARSVGSRALQVDVARSDLLWWIDTLNAQGILRTHPDPA
jgi:hypothetical protein